MTQSLNSMNNTSSQKNIRKKKSNTQILFICSVIFLLLFSVIFAFYYAFNLYDGKEPILLAIILSVVGIIVVLVGSFWLASVGYVISAILSVLINKRVPAFLALFISFVIAVSLGVFLISPILYIIHLLKDRKKQ